MTEDISLDFSPFLPSFWTKSIDPSFVLGSDFEIINLDSSFVDFLESDGIFLDDGAQYSSNFSDSDDSAPEAVESGDSISFSDSHTPEKPSPLIHNNIMDSLKRLGGCVVPKLNWTAPKDSIWISANTLKCTNSNDIYQLLKASDRIQSDLSLWKKSGLPAQLFLRKFVEVLPESEFRCFVINGNLIGISQRNLNVFCCEHASQSAHIKNLIVDFFHNDHFDFPLDTYSFDVTVDVRSDQIRIVDFNPLQESSLACLYTYEELVGLSSRDDANVDVKFIKSNAEVRIGWCERNFLPVDLLNFNGSVNDVDFNNFPLEY